MVHGAQNTDFLYRREAKDENNIHREAEAGDDHNGRMSETGRQSFRGSAGWQLVERAQSASECLYWNIQSWIERK